jgi:hypothetical protein
MGKRAAKYTRDDYNGSPRAASIDPAAPGSYLDWKRLGYTLNKQSLNAVEISLPEVREQQAIAEVLSDLDAEINVLEARRDKTRQIKQGMMQSLLTGRIRLV